MTEVWLRSNRRALMLALIPVVFSAGAALAIQAVFTFTLVRLLAYGLIFLAVVAAGILVREVFRPRVGYRDGRVLFYLNTGKPAAVPAGVVEAFFIGQGPASLPAGLGQASDAANLIARLSQKEPQWANAEVKPSLGRWCGGYVTIRGAWCEPLNGDVIRRLNRRLREVSEASESRRESESTSS